MEAQQNAASPSSYWTCQVITESRIWTLELCCSCCFLLVLTLASEFQILPRLGSISASNRHLQHLSGAVWLAEDVRAELELLGTVWYPRQPGMSIRHLQTSPLHHTLDVSALSKLPLTVFLSPHVSTTC